MSFSSEASKLLTNKYFLYFIVFLAASNVLGYLVTNKVNAVIFFALVAFLASNFSKNMTVILLVAIVATNLLMANKSMREGLENATTTTNKNADEDEATDKLDSVDPELSEGLKTLQSSENTEDAKQKLEAKKTTPNANDTTDTNDQPVDPNNRDLNNNKDTSNVVGLHSKKSGFHNPKSGSSLRDAAPVNGGSSRIDYATTLEDAYDNLDKILGSDGINKLTNDTQRLMQQQQKLFDTMSNMMPMINSAKDMMGSIDMSQLGGLADLAGSLGDSQMK